jgi:nitroreductase
MSEASQLYRARYGADGPSSATAALAHPVIESLLAHRSVRGYLPTPLPNGTLEALVASAQSAASSSNLQAYGVVAVEDGARKRRLAELAGNQAHIVEAPLFLAWLVDTARLRGIATRSGRSADGLDYLDTFLMGAIDAALAAQNAVVAAEALGLGTVYIGALRNKPELVAEVLGLPDGVFAVFGLCVGYPDPARLSGVKPRLPQQLLLHRERYDLRAADEEHARYDRALAAFQAEQGLPVVPWTEQSTTRVAGASALNGRDRLREALGARGFAVR